jgi:hypothetical protein
VVLGGASARADVVDDPLARQEARQRQALVATIGTPRCTRDDACWAVPVGARPCGGPEVYLVASRDSAAVDTVRRLARAHADTRRAQNQRAGRLGICTVLSEPAVRCDTVTQRCELVDGTPAGVMVR